MFNLIFADDYLMVIDKKPGVVVTSTDTQKEPTLEDYLKSNFKITAERSGIVHRLDKDTSGLMVVGKTDSIVSNLQAQFKERVVKKSYLALVHGWMEKSGRIEVSMGRNPRNREKFTVFDLDEEEGKASITDYQPEKQLFLTEEKIQELFPEFNKIQLRKLKRLDYERYTKVRCFPLTGRTHQIRVHLKHIGFPIVGDGRYGGRRVERLDHRWCSRQFLHAATLEFEHPVTLEKLKFESPLPEDLQLTLGQLLDYNVNSGDIK